MSDLADKAAAVQDIESRGGSFAPPSAASRELRRCACGGKPAYRAHPPLRRGGDPLEILVCGACGNAVGPFSARHQLATAWKLGGWKGDINA